MSNPHEKPLARPPGLRPGDTVGIVAPAGAFQEGALDFGIELLKETGFSVRIPEDLYAQKKYLAGSDRHRAAMLNRFFSDDSIQAIVCARGGFGSMRILDRLDYAAIRNTPKIFLGFSDITALLWALYARCAMIVFHGPVLTSLQQSDTDSVDAFRQVFFSNEPVRIVPDEPRVLQPGIASGRVVGGNLATLCHLVGTDYQPDFNGCLVLLEDRGEPLYKIDRMLTQLHMAGSLEGVSGILLGGFESCGAEAAVFEIVYDRFYKNNIPIMGGFPIGHGRRNITVPLGDGAVLDTDRGCLSFHGAAVRSGGAG
ncbi:MAG: S66 peptidase family protein [Thermodesulfobacteriota bacterium]